MKNQKWPYNLEFGQKSEKMTKFLEFLEFLKNFQKNGQNFGFQKTRSIRQKHTFFFQTPDYKGILDFHFSKMCHFWPKNAPKIGHFWTSFEPSRTPL